MRKIYVLFTILVLSSVLMFGCNKDEESEVDIVAETGDDSLVQEEEVEEEETESKEESEGDSLSLDKISGQFDEEDEEPSIWSFNDKIMDNWSMEVPFFNPLGEEANYSEVDYDEDTDLYISYYDDDFYEQEFRVYGDVWKLTIPFDENKSEEDNLKFNRDLKRFVIAQDGIVDGLVNDGFVFTVFDGQQRWRGSISRYGSEYNLELIKEREIYPGETITIRTDEFEDNELYFSSYNDENYYQSALIQLDKGYCSIEVGQRKSIGDYSRRVSYDNRFEYEVNDLFVIDSLPYDVGHSSWELTWPSGEDMPSEINITLTNLGEQNPVVYGRDLGAVKIGAKLADTIEFIPVGNDDININHPEYDEDQNFIDKTFEGDYLISLPAGYWQAIIRPGGETDVEEFKTGLIPVSAGELTTIEIPLALEKAMLVQNEKFEGQEGMKIDKINDLGSKVAFDFTLIDNISQDILPDLDNTFIKEGGQEVEILEIVPVKTPPSVVLLLDSSGSMKGQLTQTLSAAKDFISQLPDDTYIELIDFDDEPKLLEGTTKEQALNNLELITVGGSTALYDSVVLGLEQLKGLERATLVAFTDGEDENHTVPGSGSQTSKEECIEIVKEEGIQLLTIGFGEGHDSTALKELADAGFGFYYSADNSETLEKVFQAINEKLNSTYTATYQRPTKSAPSDVPVISLVLDVSGSMNSTWDETCGYRLDKVKNMFHNLVLNLPENTQIQLIAFNDEVVIEQIMTSDKLKVLRALAELDAGGGTNILDSVKTGFETLDVVPSSKKVMIYLTDAALGVEDEDQENFDKILDEMALENLNVLWLGLGEELDEEDFLHASNLSGGEYFIGDDVDKIQEAAEKLLEKVDTSEASIKTSLALQVEKVDEKGLIIPYSASELAELKPLPQVGQVDFSEAVIYKTGEKIIDHDQKSAEYLSGYMPKGDGLRILKRMELDASGANEAMEIHVSDMIFLSEYNGVPAPEGSRFVALFTEASHILPSQEVVVYPDGSGHPASWVGSSTKAQGTVKQAEVPYVIPNVFSHFSLSYNNDGMYPLSTATWIASKSLVVPGVSSLTLNPDKTVDGALVFIVPFESMEQVSLHYYDTDYGHVNMPLVGEMTRSGVELESLPLAHTTKLSDNFNLSVEGYLDEKNLMNRIEASDETVFKLIEGAFESNVQANIDINVDERIRLGLSTDNGDFLMPLSPVTELIPFGMNGQVMVSPGASNKVRYAFQIPEVLADHNNHIFIDLADEDGIVEAASGYSYGHTENVGRGTHEYANVTINQLVKYDGDIHGYSDNFIVADITIDEVKDGSASRGIISNLNLVIEGYDLEEVVKEPLSTEEKIEMALHSGGLSSFASSADFDYPEIVRSANETDQSILGFTDDTIFYDGTSRRGFIIYEVDDYDVNYKLQSDFFEGLDVSPSDGDFDGSILAKKQDYDFDDDYQEAMEMALEKAIIRYEQNNPSEVYEASLNNDDLDEGVEDEVFVPVPMISIYGAKELEAIDSLAKLKEVVKELRIVENYQYSERAPFVYEHSPEAVLSQGWGTINDINYLCLSVLTKLGLEPEPRIFELNENGIAWINEFVGSKSAEAYMTGVLVYDENGIEKSLAMPIMEDIRSMKGLGHYTFNDEIEVESEGIYCMVEYYIEPTDGNLAQQLGDAASALGGGEVSKEPEWERIFSKRITKDTLSNDSIDIGVTINEYGFTPVVYTSEDVLVDDYGVDKNSYNIKGIRVTLELPGEHAIYESILEEGMEIEDVFITIGANLPNLTNDAFETLVEEATSVYDADTNADVLSALRWNARKSINRFVAVQSDFEQTMARAFGLNVAHVNEENVFLIAQYVNEDFEVHMDLLNPVTQILGDDDTLDELEEAGNSYRIMAGAHASLLEGQVLDNGYGIQQIWDLMPADGEIIYIDPAENEYTYDEFIALGMTEAMAEYLEGSRKHIIIPNKASTVQGQQRWAWMEIDPYTYETISVLDTFEHGAMTGQSIIKKIQEKAKYYFGKYVGIKSSVWAVSEFSLINNDYEAMKKAAYEYAKSLKDYMTMKGVKDYSKGYADGVEYYFRNIK